TKAHINALAKALNAISKQYYSKQLAYPRHSFSVKFPFQLLRPRLAFDAPNKCVNINDAEYQVSNESIMIYPPGIPLIIPGEVFTPTLIKRINNYKKTGITILSHYDNGNVDIVNLENWRKYKFAEIKLKEYEMNHLISPRSDDYIAPFEGKEHQGTLMLLPYRSDTWRLHGEKARANYLEVVRAIAKYEKVYLGIDPSIYTKVIDECMQLENVECLKIKYNDAWARDNMPIFVSNGEKLRCVDFRFNAWGGTFDGLYSDYQDDDRLSAKVAKFFNLESYHVNDFVFEGGSISLDGEGTCLVTEACLLSEGRNPQYSKYEIEEMIKEYFNVSKIIWLKHGIYKDETNEHVDNMACFARPGVILLAWCDDKEDPQYKYSQNVYRKLSKEEDAQGMPFKIIKVRIPGPLYVTADESKGVTKSRHDAKARLTNDRLAGSYINFYQSDKFVILPSFGVTQDEVTLRQFKKIFPEKDIIQMNTREILLGGGNIHCITMQIPKVEGKKEC
ncbi:MAG: agmatine deiminase, partial [Bacilli bacterium]